MTACWPVFTVRSMMVGRAGAANRLSPMGGAPNRILLKL
jgi:hypothetical protein